MEHDLIVIGGGAGGLASARSAARRGATVLLVDHGRLGGECTFTGCVPSKTLLEAAHRGLDFDAAMATVHRVVEAIAATETDEVLLSEGVDVVHGWATLRAPGRVDVDGQPFSAGRLILATGSRPAVPAIQGLAEADYLTNENVFDLDRLPARFAVLGGGPVGCELAQAFCRLGSQVILIESQQRLLGREEPEASAVIADAFGAEGIEVRTGDTVGRVEKLDSGRSLRLHLAAGAPVVADQVLVAVGRRASTEGLGLDEAGIGTENGFITTDDELATTAKGIWAVGDVTGKLQFTHAADEMGRIAAANALSRGRKTKFRTSWIPWVTFTQPEVARVGHSEAEAARGGGRVAYLPMTEVDRAVASGETTGFIKLIAGPRHLLRNVGGGRVLGATVVASRAGEMIHEASLAMRTRMFAGRLAQSSHAYPTWSMAVQKAAAQFFFEIEGRRARPALAANADTAVPSHPPTSSKGPEGVESRPGRPQ
jgi:pyruvate/2-oxoglutarate dehydrogenase complex dihydrolipoamide dehydrogenase (E3) component